MSNQVDEYIAHVKRTDENAWVTHALEDHLRKVGCLAAEFASAFSANDWANKSGIWHDLGKYRAAFQGYIRNQSGFDPDAHIEQAGAKVDHSTAGALYSVEKDGLIGRLVAYLIAGHHAGLPDWSSSDSGASALETRLDNARVKGYLTETLRSPVPADILNPPLVRTRPLGGSQGLHLWLRMLFSCLVDADFLDTEKFMDASRSQARLKSWRMVDLKSMFDIYMAKKIHNCQASNVNQWRKVCLDDCRDAAKQLPGVYTLTVPTGGGKTLSGMAFALEHAIAYKKNRIIVAIPYTSIIEQTAEQYRCIFGDAVLEHHSNLDPDKAEKENSRSRLASENWDSPLVVTTNVQLLESLFAIRTSRCRKLHNLVNSIIIIDEAQLLPPEFLQPILDIFRLLTEYYNVTLVLSTATQPALASVTNSRGYITLRGLDSCREIIKDVDSLFNGLSRVEVEVPQDLNQPFHWVQLAEEMSEHDTVLIIVNSRRHARELHQLMPQGTLHLSAQMCGEHRSTVIRKIKKQLQDKKPIRVVSTQLVESGVDLDFPVVYRALAGLDSIAQAAGRCNREGLLRIGKVIVFVPPEQSPQGLLRYGEQATRSVWHGHVKEPLSRLLFKRYFKQYYASQQSYDKYEIMSLLTKDADNGMIQFRTAAERFRLINDVGQSILVPYGDRGFSLIDLLKKKGPERYLLRKLQRFTVNVHEDEFQQLKNIGALEELYPGLWGLSISYGYDEIMGLRTVDALYSGCPSNSVQ